jgi:hypothetical protein
MGQTKIRWQYARREFAAHLPAHLPAHLRPPIFLKTFLAFREEHW